MKDDDIRPTNVDTHYTSMKEVDTDCYLQDDSQDFQKL